MRRLTLIIIALILLSACATLPDQVPMAGLSPQPSATPDIYALTLGNIQAQATLEAMQASAAAMEARLTATAYVPTQAAVESATERAWTMTGWTATAAVQQTASSASGTATEQAIQATATRQAADLAATQQNWQVTLTQRALDITATVDSAAASAQATALHGQAVSVELAIERERMMNKVQATAPWMALVITLAVLLVIAWRWSKVRPIQRDSRGDAPLLVINGSVYDADRNPFPLLDMSSKKASIPALTSPDIQSATTARDQMIDLATRGTQGQVNPQRKALAQKMAAQNMLPAPTVVQVITPEQARPLLGDVIPGIIRDAIETDLREQGENHVSTSSTNND
ncbi:MAG: hypothetical protein NTW32_26805 [Chloroflexi bacterium]|nr:hypothetical protein [Chloroflexota bacterium]